jgi:hypothetical protein
MVPNYSATPGHRLPRHSPSQKLRPPSGHFFDTNQNPLQGGTDFQRDLYTIFQKALDIALEIEVSCWDDHLNCTE